ncbi:MAG: DUF4465 domain-containing protein [Alistipes sp.]|nr:DUF4465 domain-containing protein [Alistipes sp.]
MKKIFMLLAVAIVGISMTGCYDDDELWNEMEQIKDRVTTLEEAVIKTNEDIVALQTIINALQKNIYVTSVTPTANGYTIQFSDGTTAEIKNGKDGANGANAPVISVKQDADGNYYWTMDGEWLLVDGERVRANGIDGEDGANGENGIDGKDAIAPQVRINDATKEWEISTDGGQTWTSTGVVAEGKDGENGANGSAGAAGDSLFKDIDTSNPDYVVITLADGTEFRLARYDESAPLFIIDAPAVAEVEWGKSVEFMVEVANVADYMINTPEGWRANYSENILKVTAPEKDLCHFNKEGVIAIMIVSEAGKSDIVKLNVMAGEWVEEDDIRILTFEDSDAKFSAYELYGGASIKKWSDLVDDSQYGGSLTYTNYSSDTYWWYDEGNTELFHSFTTPYWGGGHVISNYVLADYENLPDGYYGWYEVQMSNPIGGHNGSKNFAVHNGYSDFFNSQLYDASLKGFEFADGKERIVECMYVTNTNYVLNSLTFGDGFNSAATENTYFKIVAYGYNANEELVGTSEFTLCNGRNFVTTWEKWDLSSLGKVAKITFNFSASDDQSGSYGLNTPAYFAYDDVTVKFDTKRVFK